jgi:hypothetical protein
VAFELHPAAVRQLGFLSIQHPDDTEAGGFAGGGIGDIFAGVLAGGAGKVSRVKLTGTSPNWRRFGAAYSLEFHSSR